MASLIQPPIHCGTAAAAYTFQLEIWLFCACPRENWSELRYTRVVIYHITTNYQTTVSSDHGRQLTLDSASRCWFSVAEKLL